MQSNAYPLCCGMTILSEFPYDGGAGANWPSDYTAEKAKELIEANTTYRTNGATMIILNQRQKAMQKVMGELGFVEVGTFKSTHADNTDVKVYVRGFVKGVAFDAAQPPKPVKVEPFKEAVRFDAVVKKIGAKVRRVRKLGSALKIRAKRVRR